MSVEEVYRDLLKNAKKSGGSGKGKGQDAPHLRHREDQQRRDEAGHPDCRRHSESLRQAAWGAQAVCRGVPRAQGQLAGATAYNRCNSHYERYDYLDAAASAPAGAAADVPAARGGVWLRPDRMGVGHVGQYRPEGNERVRRRVQGRDPHLQSGERDPARMRLAGGERA